MRRNKSALEFKKAWKLIAESQLIFLTTHESTDGDDLGSLLALKRVLGQMGKVAVAGVKKGVPPSLRFLPGSETVSDQFVPNQYDLVITFGCNKIDRTGLLELSRISAQVINFDHHPDNSRFGDVNVIDSETAAVAELVYYFLDSQDVQIDYEIATCLLTGIFTDTGGFKHSNTTAEVFEVAAQLLKKGARIDKIATQTFGQKRPQTLRAWAKALENTRYNRNQKMVFSILTEEDLAGLGASDDDLQGFVSILNHIPEAKFALLLRQDGGFVRGSLRTEPEKKVDVSMIAQSFGGGGHKMAAGFRVKGKLTKQGNKWQIK